jgi:gentisate 1,2-dioxygenase
VGTEWAERRNLILANPIPGNDYPTVNSLVAAYQMVKAGETARSHRHTPNAMRIVVEAGRDTYTIVDGSDVPMEPGDVLLTPNWSFHGHNNRGNQDAYWIDILDAPLVQLLGPMFFETHPDRVETATAIDRESPMRFAYADYKPKLLSAPESTRGVRTLELGPPCLPTFDRLAIHLGAGRDWILPATTANQIYVVIEGSGTSIIGGGKELPWSRGDVLAAPAWMPQRHSATDDAVLMRMSDAPVMKAFGWLRQGRSDA